MVLALWSGTGLRRNPPMSRIETKQIDNAMRLVAILIDQGDEAYWPIMDRLIFEKQTILARMKILEDALPGPNATRPVLNKLGRVR